MSRMRLHFRMRKTLQHGGLTHAKSGSMVSTSLEDRALLRSNPSASLEVQ